MLLCTSLEEQAASQGSTGKACPGNQDERRKEGRERGRQGGRESDRRGHSHERQGRKTASLLKAPTDHSQAVQELRGRAGSGLAQVHAQPNVPRGCVAHAESGFVFNNWH